MRHADPTNAIQQHVFDMPCIIVNSAQTRKQDVWEPDGNIYIVR